MNRLDEDIVEFEDRIRDKGYTDPSQLDNDDRAEYDHLKEAQENRDENYTPYTPNYSGTTSESTMKSAQETLDKNIKDMRNEQKKSNSVKAIEKASGAREGSTEYEEYRKQVETVQNTNSTKGVNNLVKTLTWASYIALPLIILLTYAGTAYDIDIHAKMLHPILGDFFYYGFITAFTALILLVSHSSGNALINNKFKYSSRPIAIGLFLVTLFLGFYLEYRAIVNITESRLEENALKEIGTGTTSISSAPKAVLDARVRATKDLNTSKILLETYNNSLVALTNTSIKLANYTTTTEYKEQHWRRKNAHTKTIETNRVAIADMKANIESTKEDIEGYENTLKNSGDKFKASMSGINAKMTEDRKTSIIFLFAIAFIIKLASFGKELASLITNLNVDSEIQIDEINAIHMKKRAYQEHMNELKADAIESMNSELKVSRAGLQSIQQHALISGMSNVNSAIEVSKTLNTIDEGVSHLAQKAGEGVGYKVQASISLKMADSYKSELDKLADHIGGKK